MKLDVFIKGELVDLCIPTPEYAKESDWYSWFNNPKTNKFLEQGAFPNTRDDELAFYEAERHNRVLLAILDKNGENLGIISLSFIDFAKRRADIAIVLADKDREPLCALEASALLTTHAFTTMGLVRLEGGQHNKLKPWGNLLEIIGYRNEGIFVNGFIKGSERTNLNRIAINIEDYNFIVEKRGSLWDSNEKMLKRIRKMPKQCYVDKLLDFYKTTREDYYKEVFAL